jgi:hypothetical protein
LLHTHSRGQEKNLAPIEIEIKIQYIEDLNYIMVINFGVLSKKK